MLVVLGHHWKPERPHRAPHEHSRWLPVQLRPAQQACRHIVRLPEQNSLLQERRVGACKAGSTEACQLLCRRACLQQAQSASRQAVKWLDRSLARTLHAQSCNRHAVRTFSVQQAQLHAGHGLRGLSGVKPLDPMAKAKRRKRELSEAEVFEIRQLIASGVKNAKDYPEIMALDDSDEDDAPADRQQDTVAEDFEARPAALSCMCCMLSCRGAAATRVIGESKAGPARCVHAARIRCFGDGRKIVAGSNAPSCRTDPCHQRQARISGRRHTQVGMSEQLERLKAAWEQPGSSEVRARACRGRACATERAEGGVRWRRGGAERRVHAGGHQRGRSRCS